MPVTLPQLILGILIPLFVIGLYGLIALPKNEDYIKKILRPIVAVIFVLILITLVVTIL